MSASKKTAKSSMDNFVVKRRRTTSAPPTPYELHDELFSDSPLLDDTVADPNFIPDDQENQGKIYQILASCLCIVLKMIGNQA